MKEESLYVDVGARCTDSGSCAFTLWAPRARTVDAMIMTDDRTTVPMSAMDRGYWYASLDGVAPGTRYLYRIDGVLDLPDPASRYQPQGVHGPSAVVDHRSFSWEDEGWQGLPLREYVVYELHVGTFTPEGTFEAAAQRLDHLAGIGVTAVELMPVAQFPGARNWGYDGVYPFAVQNSYGGPASLTRLVNECHRRNMAVIIDVVYNHLGPEGNYFDHFGPYFTDRYQTPWGKAINFDGPMSGPVRSFFIKNALHWIEDYHCDALRIDAIHGIFDFGATHFLKELAGAVHSLGERLGRRVCVIAESDLNDVRVITPPGRGGYGVDAQWNDDFHHSLHTLLTGERNGYFKDFGKVEHLARAFQDGFVYSGQYSEYRLRNHGSSFRSRPAEQLVVCGQNHDQVGNRLLGERLSSLVSFEALKLAASTVLLSPFIPLLFMGEEYGESAPFLYFVDHSDQDLIQAVRKGRQEEFRAFHWNAEMADPQSPATFLKSRLRWETLDSPEGRLLYSFYAALIRLRGEVPPLANLDKDSLAVETFEGEQTLAVRRWDRATGSDAALLLCFSRSPVTIAPSLPPARWSKVLASSDPTWGGPGPESPSLFDSGETLLLQGESAALFVREGQS